MPSQIVKFRDFCLSHYFKVDGYNISKTISSLMICCLVVSTPLKNFSQLGSLFPIYGKLIQMFQTTNQSLMICDVFIPSGNQRSNMATEHTQKITFELPSFRPPPIDVFFQLSMFDDQKVYSQ